MEHATLDADTLANGEKSFVDGDTCSICADPLNSTNQPVPSFACHDYTKCKVCSFCDARLAIAVGVPDCCPACRSDRVASPSQIALNGAYIKVYNDIVDAPKARRGAPDDHAVDADDADAEFVTRQHAQALLTRRTGNAQPRVRVYVAALGDPFVDDVERIQQEVSDLTSNGQTPSDELHAHYQMRLQHLDIRGTRALREAERLVAVGRVISEDHVDGTLSSELHLIAIQAACEKLTLTRITLNGGTAARDQRATRREQSQAQQREDEQRRLLEARAQREERERRDAQRQRLWEQAVEQQQRKEEEARQQRKERKEQRAREKRRAEKMKRSEREEVTDPKDVEKFKAAAKKRRLEEKRKKRDAESSDEN